MAKYILSEREGKKGTVFIAISCQKSVLYGLPFLAAALYVFFSSTSMATFSLDSAKTGANVICFPAVSGTPHNDQHYGCT